MAANVYNSIREYPDREVEELLNLLGINRKSLYGCLIGLVDEKLVCHDGEFLIMEQNKRLTVAEVQHYLQSTRGEGKPKRAERILYLYNLLHRNIPYEGVTFEEIMKQYMTLLEHSSSDLPKTNSLRRMIYRDIEELEKIGIIIERPSTGSRKYCLRDKYLPKLALEQASSLYVSMLLFEDTILDEVSNSAKEEFEKAFFKNLPGESLKIDERIHVVGDTLVNPSEYSDKFTKLLTAVINSYEIELTYEKLNGEVSDRILQPLGLVYKRGVWYLVALRPDRKEYRTFRVDQILIANIKNRQFVYPDDFSLATHIGSSWGVFTNDEVQKVKLKFSSKVASRFKSQCYHRSQEILDKFPDGSIIVGLEICGLIELKGWLLQWGKEVEVLEPIYLQQMLVEAAREIVEVYS